MLVLLCAGVWYAASHWPEAPQAPRYVGAGDATPRSGGTFVFAGGSNIHTFDPHLAYDTLSYRGIRLLFDGLLDYDDEGRMIPSLAQQMPTVREDGKVFRFELRRSVPFHNGREITADDVSWSMHKLLSKEKGSPGYPFFAAIVGADAYHEGHTPQIAGIRVIDRYAIEFTLNKPDQTFLNAMAMPFAYPVPRENYARWEPKGEGEVGRHPVGSGPFVFARWERGVQVEFERNSNYWKQQRSYVEAHPEEHNAHPERMIFLENIAGEIAVARFRNGDLDVIAGAPPIEYLFFKQSEAWKPYRVAYPGVSVSGLAMNCELPPFDNVHVRRAVAFAIDRQAIRTQMQGRITPTGQILPPMIEGYDAGLSTRQTYDLARAKEEMRLAGFPNGYPEPVSIWIGESDLGRTLAQLWQEDLKQIGLTVQLTQVPFATYLKDTGRPKTVQAFTSGWNMDFPDASNFLDTLFHSHSIHPENSENRSFYRNAALDAILDAARAETDHAARMSLYREANKIVARDAPWAFMSNPLHMEVRQPYVKNYRPHPIWSQDYRHVWLDLPRKRSE